jgi:RNA polymerase sigma-70 factor, ECF subfamily
MNAQEERTICRGLAAGDPEAFREIYHFLGKRLYFYLLTILRSDAAAEDAMQDFFLHLAQKRQKVAGARNLTGYLFAMARNEALLYRRRQRPPDEQLAGFESILASTDDRTGTEARERRRAVLSALDELPFEQQEVVALKVFQEMTFAEIAAALDISANTAASRYRYAIRNLQRIFGERIHEY